MKVLMLGWEFPPFFAGGVGMVCAELTKAFSNINDLEVEYVMAYGPDEDRQNKNLKVTSVASKKYYNFTKNININEIPTTIYAYDTCQNYLIRNKEYLMSLETIASKNKDIKQLYGKNLIQEVYLYAKRVAAIYKDRNDFDVIHAHDWTTVPAALYLKQLTGKPVVFHVHITELDKTGGVGGHEKVFEIEKQGFAGADILLAVSNFTKNRLINDYGVNPSKIRVVHNGGISDLSKSLYNQHNFLGNSKKVLFAGRVTTQKGPEYFIRAAQKVLDYIPNAQFIFAGGGDLYDDMVRLADDLGVASSIFFHGGAYSRIDAEKYYSVADVFVMPSVSEPFGVVPLEAIAKGTATIISKQSGVSEVLDHVFKVDFWDIDEMAHKIIALLKYDALHHEMKHNSYDTIDSHTWDKPANDIINIYQELINK